MKAEGEEGKGYLLALRADDCGRLGLCGSVGRH